MRFTAITAVSVRENGGCDWPLASCNCPDIVWAIAKAGNCPDAVWIIFGNPLQTR
jgi:hypothetical protein